MLNYVSIKIRTIRASVKIDFYRCFIEAKGKVFFSSHEDICNK